ncbi:universal stress protein [Alkalibacter mobilis]|uniref:universal stress protein n=1 Tax=Alkalibacter mobilis TaxID=2787712 RepID=UPI00189FDB18|nr:universal stress protein [Alkalibacter mobilis]MBF7097687.1 universal stress protein [Alkalibacter mobilis]
MYKKILVPTDASDFSKRALLEAIGIAHMTDGEIILLNITHSPDSYWGYTASYGINVNQDALEQLGKMAIDITLADITTDVEIKTMIRYGSPSLQIMDVATEEDVDLIVMGSHGRGFVSGALIGSVSQKILHNSKCPVLIVK